MFKMTAHTAVAAGKYVQSVNPVSKVVAHCSAPKPTRSVGLLVSHLTATDFTVKPVMRHVDPVRSVKKSSVSSPVRLVSKNAMAAVLTNNQTHTIVARVERLVDKAKCV